MTAAPPLICLGNLTIDDVVLPDGSERPGCIGGDAFYAALAARLVGVEAEMVAPRGRDLPQPVIDRIHDSGLSLDGLPSRNLPTLRNRVVYDADGGRTWTLYATHEQFDAMSPRGPDIPVSWHGAKAFLVLAMTLDAQEDLLGWMGANNNAFVALDPQEDYISGNEARLDRLIAKSDLYMPSEEEVRRHLGHEDWPRAARHYAALGPSLVVVKRGPFGALVYEKATGREHHMPALPRDAVDTTGAGDAFCGAFVASLVKQPGDLIAAACAGVTVAASAIAGYGVDGLLAAG